MKKTMTGWISTGLSVAAFFFSLTPAPAIATTTNNYSSYNNVTNFGAIGDGTNDDAGAIQAAINATFTNKWPSGLCSKSRVVYFPAGTYKINSSLLLTNYVSLLGEGSLGEPGGTAVIKAGTDLTSMIYTSTNIPEGSTNGAQKGSAITIENLTLDGGGKNVTWAMNLCDLMGGRIADVSIRNLNGGGINSYWETKLQNSWVNWFVNLNIEVSEYALRVHSSDSWVNGVHVDGGLGLLEDGYCDVLYKNCVVENCTNGLTFSTNCLGVSQQTSIADCQFFNNQEYGIKLAFTSQYYKCYVSIDGCSFADNGEADVCLSNCTRATLHNNDFMTTSPGCGQNIDMFGVASNTLTDNRFACATQTVSGAGSLYVSNQVSVTSWDNPNVIPFEIGTFSWPACRSTSLSVSFTNHYDTPPIVVAQTVTASGSTACVTYVQPATRTNFPFMIQNWDNTDVHATDEKVNYLAMKAGHYLLNQMNPDQYNPGAAVCDRFAMSHTRMEAEAGCITNVKSSWKNIVFSEAFSQTPVVFVQRASNNGAFVTTARIKDCSSTGFSLMLQKTNNAIISVGEWVNYIAITPGWSDEGDLRVLSGQSVSSNAPAPLMFGDSYMAPQFVAGMQSCNDTNPCVWRWDPNSLEKGGVRVAIEGSNTTTHGAETFGWLVSGIPDVVAPGTGTVMGCILNVQKDFFATGYDNQDNTTNIQAALDAAMPGDTVYFPEGTYYITNTLKLKSSGITLLGEGNNCQSTIRSSKADVTTMVTVTSSISCVRIAKLNFESTNTVGTALFLPKLTDSTLDRVTVDGMSGLGINIQTNSSRIRIRDCIVRDNQNCGILLAGNDCIVESSYVDCNVPEGIKFTGSGHRIINTHVDGPQGFEHAALYFVNPSSNITARNCYFDFNTNAISINYSNLCSGNIGIESCCPRFSVNDFYLRNVTNVLISGCASTDWVITGKSTNAFVSAGVVDRIRVVGNVFDGVPATIPGTNSVSYGNIAP